MQNATKKATNGVTLATTVQALPAPAATLTLHQGLTLKPPVSGVVVQAWLTANCGGNPANAGIVPLPSAGAPNTVLPFLRGGNTARARILQAHLWGFVNGHKPGAPVVLQGVTAYCKAQFAGAYGVNGYLDLCALLNGGFSPSSKTWGTPYAQLVVLPAPTTTK